MSNPQKPAMARRAHRLAALGLATVLLALLAACSVFGSGLTGQTWQLSAMTQKVPAWQGVVPEADRERYEIEFLEDGSVAIKADCNQVGGSYETTPANGLTITLGPSTLAMCPEDSVADQFTAGLAAAESYTVKGTQLTIRTGDGGTLEFVAKR